MPVFTEFLLHSAGLAVFMCFGSLVALVLSFRWLLALRVRRRQRMSIQSSALKYLIPSGRDASFLQREASDHPSVAFVMPVKYHCMKTENPKENWRTQIQTSYGGDHESIFVVENEDDGAVDIIKSLQLEFEGSAKIKLVVAGLSSTCTQKIHNMVAGVDACDASTRYILFLDANCQMHPGTVALMIHELEADANLLAATGYPLDVPPRGATIWAWTMCQFRYNNLSQFISNRSDIIWGGALLMRKSDIDGDVCKVKSCWLDGGYSDDMLVGACAAQGGRGIATPLRAIFRNDMKKNISFYEAWDFLQRQIFVLKTYGSRGSCFKHALIFIAYSVFNGVAGSCFFVSVLVVGGACTTLSGEASGEAFESLNFCWACGYFLCLLLAVVVNKGHLRSSARLVGALSPDSVIDTSHASFVMLFVSFVLQMILAPFVAICILCRRSIIWGGVTYYVKLGRVVKLERPETRVELSPISSMRIDQERTP